MNAARRSGPVTLFVACALAAGACVPAALAAPATSSAPAPATAVPAPRARPIGLAAYAGVWRLDLNASDFGRTGRIPRFREDEMHDEGPWIAVRSLSVRSSGDTVRMEFKYHTDGLYVNHVGGQAVTTRGRRDGNTLRFASETKFLMFTFAVDEHWSLSADGGSLTQERIARSALGEEKSRLVYRRAP